MIDDFILVEKVEDSFCEGDETQGQGRQKVEEVRAQYDAVSRFATACRQSSCEEFEGPILGSAS